MKQIGVGILGFGTVGAGVADGLLKHREILAERLGVDIVLKKVVDLDITTDRGVKIPVELLATDAKAALSDPEIDIIVETIGGTGVAKTFVLEAMCGGKCVVTANKKMLAEHGREIFDAAAQNGVDIYFGASVGGGIPIIRVLREGLAGNEIESIHGILNGTCNYILTRMENEGLPFDMALREAQRLGYAEADPTLDVDGFDTAHKACILSALAYGFQPELGQVQIEGIRNLAGEDVKYAAELGYRIKLLACVARDGDEVEVGVHPALIPFSHMLSNVHDAFNAAYVKGDMSDYTMYYGRGAGRAPTASTVIGDIGDIARNLAFGETRYARAVPAYGEGKLRLRVAGDIASKFYLRFMLASGPDAMEAVESALGRHGVPVSALSRMDRAGGDSPVPVVAMTGKARAADVDAALAEVKSSGAVTADPVKLRVLQ